MNSIKQAVDQLSCFDRVVLFFRMPFFFFFFLSFSLLFFPPLYATNPLLFFFFSIAIYKLMNIILKRQSGHASKGIRNLLSWQIVNSRVRREGNNICAYGPVYGVWSHIRFLNADCTNIQQDSCTPENHHDVGQELFEMCPWDLYLTILWFFDLLWANGLNLSLPWDEECKTIFETLISVRSHTKHFNIPVLMHYFQNDEVFYPTALYCLLRGKKYHHQTLSWKEININTFIQCQNLRLPWKHKQAILINLLMYFRREDLKRASLSKKLTDHSLSPCCL